MTYEEYEQDKEKVLVYLDKLRESGETNMFDAIDPYLVSEFCLMPEDAHKILQEWMSTFGERNG